MIFNEFTLQGVVTTGKRYMLTDDSRPGFVVKVSPFGTAQFYHRRKEHTVQKEIALGKTFSKALADYTYYHQATVAAAITKAAYVAPGELFYPGHTVASLCQQYMKHYVLPRLARCTEKNYTYFLDILQEHLAGHEIAHGRGTVDSARVLIKQLLRDTRDADKPVLCNRMKSCYSSMFKWGVEEDIVTDNPMYGMPTAKERPKSRRFNDDELRLYLHTLDSGEFNPSTVMALKLILLTGCRPGEIISIRNNEAIDTKEGRLTIPVTKNGLPHLVALSTTAQSLLMARQSAVKEGKLLFPTSVWGLRQVSRRSADRAKVTLCTSHDLRRTFATMCGSLGITLFMIEKLLNHSPTSVTAQHYALFEHEAEKRAACEIVAKHLVSLGLVI